ncbi:MAG TPA: archaetidylserine decarboxylase [Myxococcota bacterium]|nr:archaetidylserine decarboxylase [Myxococcota bacterium]
MPPALPGALVLGALRRLPVHALSRAAGRAAAVRLPAPLRVPAWRAFARAVGADLSEVRDPLDSFGSLQEFFTRALRADVRAIDADPAALVAPCDGTWGEAGRIEGGALLQVKGRPYSLAALLGDADAAKTFEGGWFATFYLAPRDYHRFHAPCDGFVARAAYLPGSLWPVNRIGVERVPNLFAENERICAWVQLRAGDAGESLALVAVGATLVGKVHVAFDTLTTNARDRAPRWRRYDPPPRLVKGVEWGRFEFGSTIVLVSAPGAIELAPRPPGSRLELGERIGTLAAINA